MAITRSRAPVVLAAMVVSVCAFTPPLAIGVHGADRAGITAREFLVEPPTLINLGFEWFVDGDDNRNATVQVTYRKTGDTSWQQALPLLRLQGERIKQGQQIDVTAPNMFAGSILDLEPDTSYDTQFVLTDPDGVSGESRKIVIVRTRPEPMPAGGGKVYHVYPAGFKGPKTEPSF